MSMTNDEIIEEIVEMCNGMTSKPEYVDEVIQGDDLHQCSQSKLYQKRKLAQIYLHEYHMLRKDEIQDEMTAINQKLHSCEDNASLKGAVEGLNTGKWFDYDHRYNSLRANDIGDVVKAIEKYKEEGLITGTYKIEFNLSVNELDEIDLPLLEQKLALIKESQMLDRLMQRHMKKKAPCLQGDAYYERMIKTVEKQIEKIKNTCI